MVYMGLAKDSLSQKKKKIAADSGVLISALAFRLGISSCAFPDALPPTL